MSGPVNPPLKVTDGTTSIRPTRTITFDSADFTVTDNGNGNARIDVDAGGSADLTDTYIGFGSASNLLTGSANFTFTEESGGSGPTVRLKGDKPLLYVTDDTSATTYTTRMSQSGSSFYIAHEDSTGTDNQMFRIASSYVSIQPTMQPRVGIGNYGTSGVALHIVDDGTDDMLRIESTDAGSSNAPRIELFRNSASPADADSLGAIYWAFQDDGGGKNDAGYIKAYISDASATSEDADFYWYAINNGSLLNMMAVRGGIRAVEVNVNEADIDFIANGDTVGELLHVDASQENCGVGGSPSSDVERLHVKGTGTDTLVRLESSDSGATNAPDLELFRNSPSPANADYTGAIRWTGYEDTAGSSKVDYARIDTRMFNLDATENGVLVLYTRQNNALRPQISMKSTGVIINENQESFCDFAVETTGNTTMLFVDSGLNRVSVGSTPTTGGATLQVPDNTISSYANVNAVRSDGVATQTMINADCQGQLWVNDSATAWTLDLPESTVKGQHFRFVSTNGNMTVDPNPSGGTSNTINGSTGAISRDTDNQIYEVVCISANTWLLNNP